MNLIELPKFDRLHAHSGALAAWVAYFEHFQEDAVMNDISHAPIRQALQQLQELSADDEARRLAFVRERALRDELSELRAARREGLKQGLEQGLEQGNHDARVCMARRLIGHMATLDDPAIADITGLTADEVHSLRGAQDA